MGCCLTKPPNGPKPDPVQAQTRPSSRSAPPPEEETETIVKEVLSETPKPVITARPVTQQKPVIPETHKMAVNANADLLSEASDITGSTVTENIGEEFSSEFRRRSPAKIRRRNNSGERREWGAPVRKPGPSPARERRDFGERNVKTRDFGAKTREFGVKTREFGERSVKTRDFGEKTRDYGERNVTNGDFGEGNVKTRDFGERKGEMRDFGETSGRRDKSPAMRPGLGRSGSTRKTGKSPARVVDERAKMEEDGGKVVAGDESLENPLVSLECFIFL